MTSSSYVCFCAIRNRRTKSSKTFSNAAILNIPRLNKDCQFHCHWPKTKNDLWSVFQIPYENEKPKNRKTKKKIKIRFFKSYKKGKTESIKWIRIPFPSRRGKNEKRKWKSNFVFLRQRKTKIKFVFHFPNNWKSVGTKVHGFYCPKLLVQVVIDRVSLSNFCLTNSQTALPPELT